MKKMQLADFPNVQFCNLWLAINLKVDVDLEFVSESKDENGHWERSFTPLDRRGPCRIVYGDDFVEIWRTRTKNASRELVAVLDWDDEKFKEKILAAANANLSAENELCTEETRARQIHAYIEAYKDEVSDLDSYEFGGGGRIIFQDDETEAGVWETVVMPEDLLGPCHVVYRSECIEVWRYWTEGSDLDVALVILWDDPHLLTKVLVAATEDICADWHSMI